MKKLKRIADITIVLFISIFLLVSCSSTPDIELVPDHSKPATASSSAGAASSIPGGSINQSEPDTSEFVIDPSKEPPLRDEDWAIAVPDFLTEEQQLLYRRASNLYYHTCLGPDIEYAGSAVDLSGHKTVQIGEYTYFISKGPYQNWDDFYVVMRSVFTEDYWNNFIDNTSLKEHDGQLCFLDTSLGIGDFYDKTSMDTFRLESQTDTEIRFTLIGHYAGRWMDYEINTTGEELHRYTLEFPIRLVLTENGWRFDEFHSALLEEDYPF